MKRWLRFVFVLVVLFVAAVPSHAASLKSPGRLIASTVSASEIRLAWSDNSGNETGFKIQRAFDSGGSPGPWTQIAVVGANVTSFRNTSLPANTKYLYRVRAYNQTSESALINSDSATTLPRPPSNLMATAVSATQINLSWVPDAKGQGGFKIERSPGSIVCAGAWRQIAVVGATVTKYSDKGVAPGTTYWYRVRANNCAGDSAYSSVASATTPTTCVSSISWWGYPPGIPPTGLTGVTGIAAGPNHCLALKSDGTIVGWGEDYYGEATSPTNLTGVIAIAAGDYHSLALRRNGTVVGWGDESSGATMPPTNLTGVVAIAAGNARSFALRNNGTVATWGYGRFGQPPLPTNLTGVVAIAANDDHFLALKSDNTVFDWRYGGYGPMTTPTNLTGVVAIAAGYYHSLALKSDGTVVGWGDDYFAYATPPTNLTGVVAIAAGYYQSLALKSDGMVVGWGPGYWGPVMPEGLTGRATAIAAGYSYDLALAYAPSPPSAGMAMIIATNQIKLSWFDNSANEDGFKIQRALDTVTNGPGIWAQIGAVGANVTDYTDTGVMTGVTYWYRVQAFDNGCGDSPFGQPLTVSVTAPTAPYSLSAIVGATNLSVLWYEYFASVDGFKLERATDSNGAPGTWSEIATLNTTNNSYGYYEGHFNDTGVMTNTTYWYRVRAFNPIGDSPYSDLTFVSVVPPTAPWSLYARPFADKVNLEWYNPSGEIGGFKIERATDNGGAPGLWAEIATVSGYPYKNTYTDTGRTLNTRYWYRVRSFNWVGDSPYSNEADVTILPPAAPYSLTGLIGTTNQVNLLWYEFYGDQDGYRLERAPDAGGSPGMWTELATFSVSDTTYGNFTDTNVTAFTTNWYRVRAFNLFGDSPYSDPSRVDIIPPPAPSNLTSSPFADRVNLSWYGYYDTYGIVGGYKIERATDVGGSPGAWAEIATVSGYSYNNTYTDTGRTLNTRYWYRVRAFNWIGDSPYSDPASTTIVPPAAPNPLTARIGSTNHIDLAWYAGTPQDQDGFKVERAMDVAGSPGAWAEIATVLATNYYNSAYSDSGVTANLTYWYRVRAFNVIGISPYSSAVNVKVVPPPAPASLTASAFRDQINLSWYNNYFGEYGIVDGFKLERATDADGIPGTWMQIADVPVYASSYSDPGRAANTTYWYRVRAYNWIGDSAYSDWASATIMAPSIPSLTANIGVTNQVDLSVYDNYGDQDGFKLERAPDDGGSPGTWTEIIPLVLSSNAYNPYFADTNVTANTTNWYRVRAFNLVGVSDYSDPTLIRIVPPPGPSYARVSVFANKINLSWYAYFNDYGNVDGFKIERALDAGGTPGAWTEIATLTTNVSRFNNYYAYTDPGLAANTIYWYRVRAYNWVGASPYTDPAGAMIVPPAAPYYVAATLSTNNRVNVFWYESPTDQDGFKLERAPDAGGGPVGWVEIATILATNTSDGSYTDTNVTANSTNWYRVRAFNVVGISDYSGAVVRIVPPPAPTSLYANSYRDQIKLNWYSYYEGVDGFKLERAPDAGGSPGTWAQIVVIAGNVNSFSDTGLTANETYWYRLRAYNWSGDGPYSPLVSAAIVPPATPSSLAGTVGNTNQVNLTWYDNATDEDGFRVERAPDTNGSPGIWEEIATVFATNSYSGAYVDTNVTAYTTNWYRVRAFNLIGLSQYSVAAPVRVVPPGAPSYLSAYPSGDKVNLQWYNYDNGVVGGFKIERATDTGGSPGAWEQIGTTTNSDYHNSFTDTGRAVNVKYWYRVQAYNWVGVGDYSIPTSVTIVTPAAAYLSASLGDSNRVDLSLYKNPSDQDGYEVERASDIGGGPGSWVEIATIFATNSYDVNYTDTNVLANTTNWYRARAFNAVGISPYSTAVTVEIVPPGVPLNLNAWAVASNQVSLYWSDYVGRIEGYKLERATIAGGVPGNWVQIAKLAGQYNTYYTDTSVKLNKSYWYRVRAYNWIGDSAYSVLAVADVSPPSAPANLIATNDWRNQIALAWVNTSTNVNGFKIERAPDASGAPGNWIQIASINSFVTNYADLGRTAGKTYWYRVRAYNDVGNSLYSNEVGALVRGGQFVRVMQWNVEHNLGRQANNYNYQAQSIARIVNYNQPDVLLFNAIDAQSQTVGDIEAALIDWVTNNIPYLGTEPGATFYVAVSSQTDGSNRNATISRYPVLSSTTYDDGLRGLHSLQVQLSAANALQIFQAHLKCCADDCGGKQTGAQFAADTIDAFAATNALPYLFAGDWGEDEEAQPSICPLSDLYHPITTIRQEAGLADFKPTTLDGESRTWSSRDGTPSIRFDYILAATNRFTPISGYVFNSYVWANRGLYNGNYYDNYYASDHYCVFANYYFTNPNLTVSPGTLASSGYPGGPFTPTNQSYTLSNASAAPLTWTAGKTTSWLDLSAAGGTLAVGASTNVTVALNANADSLAPNIYLDTLSFSNTTDGAEYTTRTVTLTVNNPTRLTVSPAAGFAAIGAVGGPFTPTNRTYTLSNPGIATMNWTAGASANWLTFSASGGALSPGASTNVTVSLNANANSLAANNYSDTMAFNNTTDGTGNTTRDASLTVTAFGFFDDFSTFAPGNLVGQRAWGQALSSTVLPLQVSGGQVVIAYGQSGDYQDAYKNFTATNATVFYGLTLSVDNAPNHASPSYFAALYTGNNASGFANYRLTARDTGSGNYVLGARITGQTADPYSFGGTALNYGTPHHVIVEATGGGTIMNVFVDPTSALLADQFAYLINYIGGGTPSAQAGAFVISQFGSAFTPNAGVAIAKACVSDNFANVYYFLTRIAPPAASGPPTATTLRITSVTRTGNDVLITWQTIGGTTNVVQAAKSLDEPFLNLSPNLLIPSAGTTATTSYLDAGAVTNASARFYRIRLAP